MWPVGAGLFPRRKQEVLAVRIVAADIAKACPRPLGERVTRSAG